MKVLLIDDEEDVRRIAEIGLVKVGHMETIEAESGADGFRLAVEQQPDFILLDMMMPGLDGPSTLRMLQSHSKTANIPVIFLTAKAMKGELEHLITLGAAGCITKPFNPMTLASDALRLASKTAVAA